MKYDASLFLRIGLAFVFIYAAISAFVNPEAWIGFIPAFIGNSVTRGYFLFVSYAINLILGLWILSGKKIYYSAVVTSIVLAGIIMTNLGAMIIIFRDIGLFFAAVALAVLSKNKK